MRKISLSSMRPQVLFDSTLVKQQGMDCGGGDCACSLANLATDFQPSILEVNYLNEETFTQVPNLNSLELDANHSVFWGLHQKPAVVNHPAQILLSQFKNVSKTIEDIPAEYKVMWGHTSIREAIVQMLLAGLIVTKKYEPPTFIETNNTLTAWLHITDRCNLRCLYCYLPHHLKDMSAEVGYQAIEVAFRSAINHNFSKVKLKYAGGEPILRLSLLLSLHQFAKGLAQKYGLELEGVVLSNGTLLTSDVAEQLQTAGLKLMISLDGLGKDHDIQRPYAGGKNSFDDVIQGIKVAQAHNLIPNISITVTGKNARGLSNLIALILD